MNTANFCAQCGQKLNPEDQGCPNCKTKITQDTVKPQPIEQPLSPELTQSPKSGKVALFLCLFFGMLGIHRFYVGKITTGILMLFTGGGIGIWALFDLIAIAKNKFKDSRQRPLLLTNHLSPLHQSLVIVGSIISWFIIFVLFLIAMVHYATNDLVTTINNQLDALRAGDINKAYSYTSTVYQHNIPIEDFKKFIIKWPVLKNYEHVRFDKRFINDRAGVIGGTLTTKDGTELSIIYQLIYEQGQWKIFAFQITPLSTDKKMPAKSQ